MGEGLNISDYAYHLYNNIDGQILRSDGLEADDIIAIMAMNAKNFGYSNVFVVSDDSDLLQLKRIPEVNIKIFRIFDKKPVDLTVDDAYILLDTKILKGDKVDNVPPAKTSFDIIRNRLLVDLFYIPRTIRNRIYNQIVNQTFHTNPKKIQLGLCCIVNELREKSIYTNRKPIMSTIEKNGLDYLYSQIYLNLRDLKTIIQWNYDNGIRVFRMSSGLMPHWSNSRIKTENMSRFRPILREIAELAMLYGQRLTFHPGQYNVIGTMNDTALQNTILDLDYHAEILDMMELPPDSVMVIHGGGVYGDKETTISRWVKQFDLLSERIKRRIVLENDERSFNVVDCLRISEIVNIPVVFDTHHHECYIKINPDFKMPTIDTLLPLILNTWHKRSIKPKFHVSEQSCCGRIGAHSDYINNLPNYLLDIPTKYGVEIDIMIEAKAKESAIFKLYDKYSNINPFISTN